MGLMIAGLDWMFISLVLMITDFEGMIAGFY